MTEPSEINYIDLEMMEEMCHPVAMVLFDSSREPMTPFRNHTQDLLDSALKNPQQTFGGKELYPTFAKKAAILYYSLIKNHPFRNGNKRTATGTLLTFLYLNGRRLVGEGFLRKQTKDYLVSLAGRVAASKGASDKNTFLNEIETWLENNMEMFIPDENAPVG